MLGVKLSAPDIVVGSHIYSSTNKRGICMLSIRQYLFILVILSLFLPLGLYPLFDLGESTFSEITRQMIASQNLLSPPYSENLAYDAFTPIYWPQIITTSLLGWHEWALRLPSALAITIWVYAVYQFSRSHLDRARAQITAVFCITCLATSFIGRSATSCALVNLCLTCNMFCLFNYLSANNNYRMLNLFYLSLGLGFLTQEYVAFLTPLLTIFYQSLHTQSFDTFNRLYRPKSFLWLCLIPLIWFCTQHLGQGFTFLQNISPSPSSTYYSTWCNALALLICMMPFSGLLIPTFQNILKKPIDEFTTFLLAWTCSICLLYFVDSEPSYYYLFYSLTPLFLLIAKFSDENPNYFWLSFPVGATFFLLVFTPSLFTTGLLWFDTPYIEVLSQDITRLFSHSYQLQMLLCGAGAIAPWYVLDGFNYSQRLIFTGLFFSVAVNFILLPTLSSIEQLPIKHAAQYLRKHPHNVVPYGLSAPSLSVYAKLKMRDNIPTPGDMVLLRAHLLSDFKHYSIQFYENGIYLIKLKRD